MSTLDEVRAEDEPQGCVISLMTSVLANDMLRVIRDLIGEGQAENGKYCLNRLMTCPILHRSCCIVLEIHLFMHC